jgi:hypothetical protein
MSQKSKEKEIHKLASQVFSGKPHILQATTEVAPENKTIQLPSCGLFNDALIAEIKTSCYRRKH